MSYWSTHVRNRTAICTPVFVGDQRGKARALLASKIVEKQVMSVMQLVNKDPSLALGTVPMTLTNGGVARVEEVDFPFACLINDLTPGVMFAVSAGYPVDNPNGAGRSLLEVAVSRMAYGGSETNVGLLLALGANPNGTATMTDDFGGTFSSAMQQAYPVSGQTEQHPGVIAMLLDAKADPVYGAAFKCPASILVTAHGWADASKVADLTKMLARLVKAGLPLDRPTGSPLMTPIQLALGKKNGNALVALVRMGATVTSEHLKGKDLFALMHANGLNEFGPAIQGAMMERVIAKATGPSSPAVAGPAPVGEDSDAPARARRRLGAI